MRSTKRLIKPVTKKALPTPANNNIYTPALNRVVYSLCAEHGYNSDQIANVIGVHHKTIDSWRKKHEGFKDAMQKGLDIFQSNIIERSLVQLCTGYEYEERTVRRIKLKGFDPDSGIEVNVPAEETITSYKKQQPNIKAISMFLSQRNQSRWRAEKDNSNTTTINNIETQNQIAQVSQLSTEQLQQLKEMIIHTNNQKQIQHNNVIDV